MYDHQSIERNGKSDGWKKRLSVVILRIFPSLNIMYWICSHIQVETVFM